jgi:CDP-diglyceride synthetase
VTVAVFMWCSCMCSFCAGVWASDVFAWLVGQLVGQLAGCLVAIRMVGWMIG